jgi:bifunctional ADP-heptose synthase (sugar kinase/adenylyltransferase)
MFDFDSLSHAIVGQTVLCVGDLMLDEFVYSKVSWISPEAPADPKSANFPIYRGATLLTPNRREFAEATRGRADTTQSIADAAQDAMQLADCDAMLVTQSEHGMTLVPRGGEAILVPAHAVKVREVLPGFSTTSLVNRARKGKA